MWGGDSRDFFIVRLVFIDPTINLLIVARLETKREFDFGENLSLLF